MALRPWTCVGLALAWLIRFASPAGANDLSRDEEVVFFPTAVPFDEKAPTTTLFVHGWIFEPEADSLTRRSALAGVAKMCDFDEQEQASALFRERAGRFLVDNERDQKLILRIGPRNVPLGGSEENGHIRAKLTLPTLEVRKLATLHGAASPTIDYRVVTPAGDARQFRGRVHLVASTGWSIVSDVDDTIKISNVLDKNELLRNTFLREFQAVPGMAEVYQTWSRKGAAFHYVSGSPWQLYQPLETFVENSKFPPGAWQLRYFRLQDGAAAKMFEAPDVYKRGAITEILRAYPNRKFILVGDTGEKDPEAYGDLARQFPEQVRFIALRNVTDATLDGARLTTALRDVPVERVLLFREAAELLALDALK